MMDSNPLEKKRKHQDFSNSNNEINHSNVKAKKFIPLSYSISIFTFIKENIQSSLLDIGQDQKENEITGLFHLLPEEILIKIFKLLTIEELSVVALVNSKIRNFIIENFLLSSSGFLFLIRASQIQVDVFNVQQQSSMLKLFSSIGLLLKRCTFLFRTNERISLLIHILDNSYGIPSVKTFQYFNYLNLKLIIKCYGKLINALINGWGDFECENVFQKLKDVSQIDFHIQKFLSSSLGSKQKQELLIRNFFRMICSHHYESIENFKEKLHWLINTLNIFSIQEVAKLFIIIFGPLVTINNSFYSLPYVAWWDLTDSNFIEKGLEDLGLTFYFLYKRSNELIWSKDYLIQIFECLINTPTSWTYSNISTLLYYAGYEMTLKFFNKKMKDGSIQDVAVYICYLNIITYKLSQDLTSILKLIDFLIYEHGNELIEEIIHAFSNVIYEIDLFNDEDQDHIDLFDTSEVIESQLELMKLSLLRINFYKNYQ